MLEPALPIWMMETMCSKKWQLGKVQYIITCISAFCLLNVWILVLLKILCFRGVILLHFYFAICKMSVLNLHKHWYVRKIQWGDVIAIRLLWWATLTFKGKTAAGSLRTGLIQPHWESQHCFGSECCPGQLQGACWATELIGLVFPSREPLLSSWFELPQAGTEICSRCTVLGAEHGQGSTPCFQTVTRGGKMDFCFKCGHKCTRSTFPWKWSIWHPLVVI